jgi:thioester reductase-like protein
MAKQILVTGATGFLGSHLSYALLRQGHHVIALARGSGSERPRDRVRGTIARVGSNPDEAPALFEKLEVVEGDISLPRLGAAESEYLRLKATIDETWHSAASLSFSEEDRDAIFKMNVGGTENIIELVAQTRNRRLHHVSTAYVAGQRTDVVMEDEVHVGQAFKNPYEESKCETEILISSATKDERIRASVYRPSIVIGDSKSGRSTHFHGVYAFIRGLWAGTRRLRRGQPDSTIVDLPLRVRGSESTTLNFVPIDYVTDAMLELASRDSSNGKTFHLANPIPTENHLWLNIVCDQLRVRGIQLTGPDAFLADPMTRMETIFHRQMAFYYQYLGGEPRFDCSHVLEGLKGTSIRCPEVTPEFARKMTGWYIDRLDRNGNSER